MRVALRMVDSRCAITKVVRSRITSSSAACTLISVVASSALVASSRMRIGGFFKQRARDRQALALAAGEHAAALADRRLEALRDALDEIERLRALGRAAQLLVGRVGLADAQVLGDRAVEQQRLLEHHADVAAQRPRA